MFEANETGGGGPQPTAEELEKDAPALPELPDEGATPEQIKAYKNAVASLPPRLAHWRGKHDKLAQDPRLTGNITPPPKEKDGAGGTEVESRLSTLEQSEEKRSFGYKHSLSPDETDRLFAYAKGAGLKPEAALEDAFFKGALAAHRRTTSNSNAIPGSSNRRPVVEGKDWDKLDEKDKRANFGAFIGAVGKRGARR